MNGTILYPVLFLFVMNLIYWIRIDHLEKEIKSEKQKSEDYRHLVDGIILALESTMEVDDSDDAEEDENNLPDNRQ